MPLWCHSLRSNGLSEWYALAHALKLNAAMTRLDVRYNNLDDIARRDLRDAAAGRTLDIKLEYDD